MGKPQAERIGDPALQCGPENLRALTVIYAGHAAALAPGDALDAKALAELHPYFADPDILAAVQRAAGVR